jgi:hypothetical protein
VDIERQTIIEKSTKMMNRPWRFQCGDLLPLVNQCAETHKMALFGKVLARFGKPTTNSFFSIEFIDYVLKKPYEHFSVLERRRCFK